MTTGDRQIMPRVETHGMGDTITTRAMGRVTQLLATFPVPATAAQLRLTDENGPKGGNDIRCALTVKLPRHPSIHVAEVATSAESALDGAVAKLRRRLTRRRTEFLDRRRHPKKYFAAAEAWYQPRA